MSIPVSFSANDKGSTDQHAHATTSKKYRARQFFTVVIIHLGFELDETDTLAAKEIDRLNGNAAQSVRRGVEDMRRGTLSRQRTLQSPYPGFEGGKGQ